VNSENARNRMDESSAGKHEYGDKGKQVKYLVHFMARSRLDGILNLMNCLLL
jgi:hypothetical protein